MLRWILSMLLKMQAECSSMDELESSVSEEKLGMEAALGVEKKEGAKECKNVEVDNSEDGFMSQSLLERP